MYASLSALYSSVSLTKKQLSAKTFNNVCNTRYLEWEAFVMVTHIFFFKE